MDLDDHPLKPGCWATPKKGVKTPFPLDLGSTVGGSFGSSFGPWHFFFGWAAKNPLENSYGWLENLTFLIISNSNRRYIFKWWFSKGIPPKSPKQFRLKIYNKLPRIFINGWSSNCHLRFFFGESPNQLG